MGLSQHLTALTRSFSSSDQGTMYVTVALAVVAIVAWLWQRRRCGRDHAEKRAHGSSRTQCVSLALSNRSHLLSILEAGAAGPADGAGVHPGSVCVLPHGVCVQGGEA